MVGGLPAGWVLIENNEMDKIFYINFIRIRDEKLSSPCTKSMLEKIFFGHFGKKNSTLGKAFNKKCQSWGGGGDEQPPFSIFFFT